MLSSKQREGDLHYFSLPLEGAILVFKILLTHLALASQGWQQLRIALWQTVRGGRRGLGRQEVVTRRSRRREGVFSMVEPVGSEPCSTSRQPQSS